MPPDLAETESQARFHMLEQLADFDDELMEQLLSDVNPSQDAVFSDLAREMNEGLIVPVFLGSAQNGFGVRRLLKAMRHELAAAPAAAARRLGVSEPSAYVVKSAHAGQAGKLAYAARPRRPARRRAPSPDPARRRARKKRVGGLFSVHGSALKKIAAAEPGEVVALGKIERAGAGALLSTAAGARVSPRSRWRPVRRSTPWRSRPRRARRTFACPAPCPS